MLLSLRIIPIPLLALFIYSLIWFLNVSSSSRCIPKCFWVDICWTEELLSTRGGWYTLFMFRKKITPWACLDGSGVKDNFHLFAKRLTLLRSLFSFFEVLIRSWTTENIEVSSTKSFTSDSRFSGKLLLYIKKQWAENWTLRHSSFDCQPFRFLFIQENSLLSFK